ncbi:hypothetical protein CAUPRSCDRAFT_12582, partial [Caulochytrium protostelioides]
MLMLLTLVEFLTNGAAAAATASTAAAVSTTDTAASPTPSYPRSPGLTLARALVALLVRAPRTPTACGPGDDFWRVFTLPALKALVNLGHGAALVLAPEPAAAALSRSAASSPAAVPTADAMRMVLEWACMWYDARRHISHQLVLQDSAAVLSGGDGTASPLATAPAAARTSTMGLNDIDPVELDAFFFDRSMLACGFLMNLLRGTRTAAALSSGSPAQW